MNKDFITIANDLLIYIPNITSVARVTDPITQVVNVQITTVNSTTPIIVDSFNTPRVWDVLTNRSAVWSGQ